MDSGLDTFLLITGNPKPDVRAWSREAERPRNSSYRRWVSPFGNLRVKGCSHLTAAYRSVPRPSSPVYAKASTNCPYLTLENPHHHRQSCLHDRRRYIGDLVYTDPSNAREDGSAQLDNQLF